MATGSPGTGTLQSFGLTVTVRMQGVVATVKQCLFDTNLADFGGGIFRGSANGDISGNVFQNNRAVKIGGAIYDSHSQVGPAPAMSVLSQCGVQPHCAGQSWDD